MLGVRSSVRCRGIRHQSESLFSLAPCRPNRQQPPRPASRFPLPLDACMASGVFLALHAGEGRGMITATVMKPDLRSPRIALFRKGLFTVFTRHPDGGAPAAGEWGCMRCEVERKLEAKKGCNLKLRLLPAGRIHCSERLLARSRYTSGRIRRLRVAIPRLLALRLYTRAAGASLRRGFKFPSAVSPTGPGCHCGSHSGSGRLGR